MSVHSRAPLRIDFAGGWTDVPEFADREGGAVVAGAITLSVSVDFLLGGAKIKLAAEDLGQRVSYQQSGHIRYDGTLDLHKAALNMLPVTGGIEILSRSDAPGGSGLGASGALDVALLAGLAHCRGDRYEPQELAELGFVLETEELKLLGGRQDQLTAALGGFHRYRFERGGVSIERLPVGRDEAADLARHLVLAYTGHSHFSSGTHRFVWERYAAEDPDVSDALRRLRDLALEAGQRLAACDWQGLAAVMDLNWREQRRLHASIATPHMRAIEGAARSAGAWAVKATGAGAGGCLAILGPAERRDAMAEAVAAAGATVLDVGFTHTGVTVWERPDAVRDG